jgi:hypothetical protein
MLSDSLTLVTRTIVPVVSEPPIRQGQVWGPAHEPDHGGLRQRGTAFGIW